MADLRDSRRDEYLEEQIFESTAEWTGTSGKVHVLIKIKYKSGFG